MESPCDLSGLINNEEGIPTAPGLTADQLQAWYQEYMDADDDIGPESHLIQAVRADKLNYNCIERRVQALTASVHIREGLCRRCRYSFQNWSDPPSLCNATVGQPVNTLQLEAAAIAGCQYCALWLRAVNKDPEQLGIFRKLEARLQLLKSNDRASFGIQSWDYLDSGSTIPLAQIMWLNFPGKSTRTSLLPGSTRICLDAMVGFASARKWRDRLDSLETAKAWLEDCCATHAECHSRKRFDAPTRLLSIGNHEVKLVLTENLGMCPPYATLSYCWGTKSFLRLTSKTLASFLGRIVDSELPKTFQDAILIARALGLSYIWIDALCIIQNDNDDWLKEAGRMRSVYGGSRVNLAATSALDAHQGCFNKPKHHCSGFHAQITTKTHSRTQAFWPENVHDEYIKGPLARRAWALQERLLPQRTLSCGEQGFFWECKRATRSEFLPDELPDDDGLGRFHRGLVCPENEPWPWRDVVESCSRSELTYGSDRLPALSGIATRQHETTGDQYLAGMWRDDLIWQLTWHIMEGAEKKDYPAWRAPTWSWASVDGAVIHTLRSDWEDSQRQITHVLDAWTTPSGPDTFGPVSGGLLTLGCPWLLCGRLDDENEHVTCGAGGSDAKRPENPVVTIPIHTDCLGDERARNRCPVYLLPLLELGYHLSEDPEATEPGSLMPSESSLGKGCYPIRGGKALFDGIIVQRCGSTQGHFRRVGHFTFGNWTSRYGWDDESDHNFLRLLERVGPNTAEAECAKVLSDTELSNLGWKGATKPRYVITIE